MVVVVMVMLLLLLLLLSASRLPRLVLSRHLFLPRRRVVPGSSCRSSVGHESRPRATGTGDGTDDGQATGLATGEGGAGGQQQQQRRHQANQTSAAGGAAVCGAALRAQRRLDAARMKLAGPLPAGALKNCWPAILRAARSTPKRAHPHAHSHRYPSIRRIAVPSLLSSPLFSLCTPLLPLPLAMRP